MINRHISHIEGGRAPTETRGALLEHIARMNTETKKAIMQLLKPRTPTLTLSGFGMPGEVKVVKFGRQKVIVFCLAS